MIKKKVKTDEGKSIDSDKYGGRFFDRIKKITTCQ